MRLSLSAMTHLLARTFALALAATCTTTSISAQSSTRMLPEPLVNALMGSLGSGGTVDPPQYFVGTLPTGFPAALVPSGPVTVMGGARTGYVTVVVLADSTRRLAPVIEALFESAGFARPATTPASGFNAASEPFRFFCKDSLQLAVDPVLENDREMARITMRRARGQACAMFTYPSPATATLKAPVLRPLAGTHVSDSGGGQGSGYLDIGAVVAGASLETSAILAHYTAQLAKAGWTLSTPAISPRVSVEYLEAADDVGKRWWGTLMVSGTPSTMDVKLVMRSR